MDGIVESLRDHLASDHLRGCNGRCYICDCGYDNSTEELLAKAADEIERLRRANDAEPVAWVNGDELANMLDDRTAVISGKRDGWRNTPLYASAQRQPESAEGFTGTRWLHLKRGTSYEVVGVAKLQTALTEGLADETPMVVYRNVATNKLSVRSLDEFCDGRFEKLGRAATENVYISDR